MIKARDIRYCRDCVTVESLGGDDNVKLCTFHSAAPYLLEAAKLQIEHYERQNLNPDVNFLGDDDFECWNKLQAAIAKATA